MNAWHDIWRLTAPEHGHFVACLDRPERAQARQLKDILATNAETAFGRRHRFRDLDGAEAFRVSVPPRGQECLPADPAAVEASDIWQLCGPPVVAYERTSGTTSAGRLIPYTEAGLQAFRRAVFPWIHDLLVNRPGICAGHAYWAVSPVAREGRGAGVRLASDADFFGPDLGPLIDRVSAAPMGLGCIGDIDTWRYLLLRHLVTSANLSLVSVWSPTFLTGLIDALTDLGGRLVDDLARGTVDGSLAGIDPALCRFSPRPDRAEALAAALAGGEPRLAALWPALDTISCWTHATAARFIPGLARALPQATIQPKGLMATEAAISIPLADHPWPVLAVNSGFFEFVDHGGRSCLCHEVEDGAIYDIRITTHSGLYRYDLGDRVRIRGFLRRTPALEFLGRGALTSDLVGEKLADDFVQRALGDAPGFAMLAPSLSPDCHYKLFLDASVDPATARARADSVDRRLCDNPHYGYARQLGQLGPVAAVRIESAMERYQAECLARGQRLGDIKPPALRPEDDWLERFSPRPAQERTREVRGMRDMEACP